MATQPKAIEWTPKKGDPVLTSMDDIKAKLPLVFFSFGVKSEKKEFPKADLYLDCRGVANPSHGGPAGNGDDIDVQLWVAVHSTLNAYCEMIQMALSRMTARRGEGKEYEKPFRIGCCCAHGVHRSRAVKHILARWAKLAGHVDVTVE